MTTDTLAPITTKQYSPVDTKGKEEPQYCPLNPEGMMLMVFDNERDINQFHGSVDSPLPQCLELSEGEPTFTPLPTGIPMDFLQTETEKYAAIPEGDAIERAMKKSAQDIIFMQDVYSEMEKILGPEEFQIFILLFTPSARENPISKEFSINYKGREIKLEDAKFTLIFNDKGGEVYPERDSENIILEHVYCSNGALCTDDFTVQIFREMTVFADEGQYQFVDGTLSDALVGADKERIYNSARALGLKEVSKTAKTTKELATEIVNKTIAQADYNRTADIIRDIVIEVADVALTAASIATGTIALKAAVGAGVRAVGAGIVFLQAGHMVGASQTLANRMLGNPKPGYNPIKETAKYLDQKAGTGHTIENYFDALNFMAVMGKTPKMQAYTGTVTATAAGTLSTYVGGL